MLVAQRCTKVVDNGMLKFTKEVYHIWKAKNANLKRWES
jgi:hypothetical protein